MELKLKVLENKDDYLKINLEGAIVEIKGVVAKSKSMVEAIAWGIIYANAADVICLCGESGVGKEVLFNIIKNTKGIKNSISVNCGAVTDSLLESELFGHKKGSFTDAVSDRKGAFVEAGEGFLFLDEIGEMSIKGQAKLLRAIEYKEIKPIGSDTSLIHKAKIVLATNRDLIKLVKEGNFRKDLFYRIEGFSVYIPALRDRKEDIEALAKYFLGPNYRFSKNCIEKIINHNWPGNVRELKNAINRAKIKSLYGEKEITWGMLGVFMNFEEIKKDMTLYEVEKTFIEDVFSRYDFNISNASRALGIPRSTLYSKLRRFELIA